jgi:hypothetical protein
MSHLTHSTRPPLACLSSCLYGLSRLNGNVRRRANSSVDWIYGVDVHEHALGYVSRALRRGRAAIFCGAGISLNSGLPTSTALIDTVLSRLHASQEIRARLLGSGLPFEAFMEIVKNMVGINELLDIFRLGRPNGNHRCIAELVRRRWVTTVCTTNFDTLIEAALAGAGLSEERDYVVLRASSDFAAFDWDDARPRLLKMHGSIDSPGTLAISLRDVSSRILSAGRRIAIEHLLCRLSQLGHRAWIQLLRHLRHFPSHRVTPQS